jgi:hypothetical protein
MPNLFSAFTSEVFRPLVTLLIPGAIAISTWFIALLWQFPVLRKTVYDNHAETGFALAFAMTFAGMVLEDLGTRVEKRLDDKRNDKTGNHNANWFAYLRTAFVTDPIGRRYIRTLVLRLKFELGAGFAMVFAALGILWLWYLGLSYQAALINLGICGAFAIWLFMEACSTHKTLADNHANLLGEIRIIPDPSGSTAKTSKPSDS